MITFRLDRVRYTYPPGPPKPSHPAQHTLICLFEWHAIPHLAGFFNVYIPT